MSQDVSNAKLPKILALATALSQAIAGSLYPCKSSLIDKIETCPVSQLTWAWLSK